MKRLNKKILIILMFIIILLAGLGVFFLIRNKNNKQDNEEASSNEPVIVEKVDIIDINSKTRPLAVSVNNTPVAVKVQEGLNKAYIVYEIPTEGSTSRLLALFKDVDNITVGTIRSARHNFIDFTRDNDGIFVAYGWSHYAEDKLKSNAVSYIQGIAGEGGMWRDNKENLATEHTVYLNTDRVYKYASDKKKYNLESNNTILLNYNVEDVNISDLEGSKIANKVTLPYGNITTVFEYNTEEKMYNRIVNGTLTKDHETKEVFNTKNIIIQKVSYSLMPDKYYWDLKVTGTGDGYYITNGYAVPIKWSKENSNSKTKYTYLDGSEINVSDGRTYIEVHTTKKSVTIE